MALFSSPSHYQHTVREIADSYRYYRQINWCAAKNVYSDMERYDAKENRGSEIWRLLEIVSGAKKFFIVGILEKPRQDVPV